MPELDPLARLLRALDLEEAGEDRFRAPRTGRGEGRMYGGFLAAQAAVAAARTVARGRLHSLHLAFLRPGRFGVALEWQVERIRDGRQFHARRVLGRQEGEPVATAFASFVEREEGIVHQEPMPSVPPPEGLPEWESLKPLLGAPPTASRTDLAMELRVCATAEELRRPGAPEWAMWVRPRGRLPDDPAVHAAFAVFVSDRTLLRVGARPHGPVYGVVEAASLDHAVWLHRAPRFDDWMLYVCRSPAAHGGRSLGLGALYSRDGTRVASTAQEGVIRVHWPPQGERPDRESRR
jgi:acyl-CoA thioesterase-2